MPRRCLQLTIGEHNPLFKVIRIHRKKTAGLDPPPPLILTVTLDSVSVDYHLSGPIEAESYGHGLIMTTTWRSEEAENSWFEGHSEPKYMRRRV